MIFSFPENILEEMVGFVGGIVESSMPLIILAIGISLAFYIIHRVINLVLDPMSEIPVSDIEDEDLAEDLDEDLDEDEGFFYGERKRRLR
ncbi:unnamed protein product [marine sediment metagenome]|uniref:Uncharacterized protein n=1 Tax=marine sediment metagenome TaxID=412755 RepID=X1LZ51_9ZZZZ